MVTIIALDCSLSMSRSISNERNGPSKFEVAKECADTVLRYLNNEHKLAHVECVSLSSKVQVLNRFKSIEHFNQMIVDIKQLRIGDTSHLEKLMQHVRQSVEEEWGSFQMIDLIVFTDAKMSSSISKIQKEMNENGITELIPFPCRLHFLCFDAYEKLKDFESSFQQLIESSNCQLVVHSLLPATTNNNKPVYTNVLESIKSYCKENMKSYQTRLHVGNLHCEINIFPPAFLSREQLTSKSRLREIKLCGFINILDVGTPPVVSKHLVLPLVEDEILLVVLYASLTQEHKVALVKVLQGGLKPCYGLLFPDREKDQQNLKISLLGDEPIPWIGDYNLLGYESQFDSWTDKKSTLMPNFPASDRTKAKCSYAGQSVSWTRSSGLQTDLQKLLRNAKKLPEKSQAFYKDLNRLRRAALTFGFSPLLHGIALLLDRERQFASGSCSQHLGHACKQLEASITLGYDHLLEPASAAGKHNTSKR